VLYGAGIAKLLALFAVVGLVASFHTIIVVIALATMVYQFQDPAYLKGVYAALAWYVAGLAYFALIGRPRLIASPEKRFALTQGQNVGHGP